jgi:hypothetical protein
MMTRRTLGLIGVMLILVVAGQIAPVQAGSRTIYGEPKTSETGP